MSKKIMSSFNELRCAQESLQIIEDMLESDDSGYYAYLMWDMKDKLLKQWADNGIIERGIKASKYDFIKDKEICLLKNRVILELARDIITHFYKKLCH